MKKTVRYYVSLVLAICLVLSLCSCSSKQAEVSYSSENPLVLKFSDVNSSNSPAGVFCETFKALVEERTQGRVKIELYFDGTLTGNDIEGTQTGIAVFSQHDVSEVTDLCKMLSVLEAPYVYEGEEQLFEITAPGSEIMSQINAELKGKGVQLVATYSWGNQQILANKPIYSEEDLKGSKIRVIPSDIFVNSMEAMGGTATPMSWGDVITSLVTNMIDGTGLPFCYIVDCGMQDIIKYVIMTEHNPTLSGVFMNEESYNKLTDEDREILVQAGAEARLKVSENIAVSNEEYRRIIEEAGVTIIEHDELDFDWDKIRDTAHESFKDDWGDAYDQILKILQK